MEPGRLLKTVEQRPLLHVSSDWGGDAMMDVWLVDHSGAWPNQP